jgi:pilus assembly protein CpaB
MKTRGLAMMVAFLLAIGATGAVFLYVQGVRKDAKTTSAPNMVSVIVSKKDIPAQSNLDNLISDGAFTTLRIPAAAIVQGAVTDVSQLKGESTAFPILQGEQITTARLQGSTTQVSGGILGIPIGYKALTLPVELSRAVGGILQAGDHITLYVTFDDVSVIPGSLQGVLTGKQTPGKKQELGDYTATLAPDVEILRALKPSDNGGQVLLTLALKPADAQKVIFAQEEGKLWVALLPPGETGTIVPPLNGLEVLR